MRRREHEEVVEDRRHKGREPVRLFQDNAPIAVSNLQANGVQLGEGQPRQPIPYLQETDRRQLSQLHAVHNEEEDILKTKTGLQYGRQSRLPQKHHIS